MKFYLLLLHVFILSIGSSQIHFDTYQTGEGDLKIAVLGHASLLLQYKGENIYVDPYSQVVDYSKLPQADLILITHEHPDHLDISAIDQIKSSHTKFIISPTVKNILGYGEGIGNGEETTYQDIGILAVPAYNIENKKSNGEPYHPKGRGNGYRLRINKLNIYIAGDTENIPEMQNLEGEIDIAFLPKNLPYTMTDEMFIDAVQKIKPKILYPYHFSQFPEKKIKESLQSLNLTLIVRPMSNK